MSDHKSTQDLIGQIERKDRRFRVAQAIFMLATLIALIIVISAQQRTLDGVKRQLVEQKAIATKADDRSADRQMTMLRRLDCMAVFFSQKDRTNLSIENIDRCTLDRGGNPLKFFKQDASGTPTTTKTEQPPNLAPSTPPQSGGGATSSITPAVPAPATTPPLTVLPMQPQPCLKIGVISVCTGQ